MTETDWEDLELVWPTDSGDRLADVADRVIVVLTRQQPWSVAMDDALRGERERRGL